MDTRETVREFYGQIADGERQTCCDPGCCGASPPTDIAAKVGYTAEQLASIPEQSNLGLGCGNPTAIAELEPGETVLDLGAGAGIDCFLAAAQVGDEGRVVGVDMTPSMLTRARDTAAESKFDNVEFRLGEIEHLPVADASVDVVISNCVVNLSPDKRSVFSEVYRVLRPGGRVSISDIVATAPIPADVADDVTALASCVSGAAHVDEVRALLSEVGFEEIDVRIRDKSSTLVEGWLKGASSYIASATVQARKPE